jgi:hypothetical protein
LQIGQKPAAGFVVGVADVVAGQHAFASDLATAGHLEPQLVFEGAPYGEWRAPSQALARSPALSLFIPSDPCSCM